MVKEGEILELTGLRFVAALYVFVFHIHIRWPLVESKFLGNILGQGAIGMSLFFMLSSLFWRTDMQTICRPLKVMW